MADEVKLVTFAGETVTPTYDAIMQELYTNGGGIITGATVTIKDANTLHIADGYAAICGREVKIFASDIPVALSSSGTLNGRLYLHMDLSQPTNPLTLLTEVAASLTPVQQDANVNTTNGIYEINLATFSVGTSTISNLVSVAPTIKNINARTLQTVNDCALSTDPQDIAGAAALKQLANYNIRKLWQNPDATQAYGTADINLSSSDYDLLFCLFKRAKNTTTIVSAVTSRGMSIYANAVETTSGTSVTVYQRALTYVDDTKYNVSAAISQTSGSSRATNNDLLIPYKIYGVKISS